MPENSLAQMAPLLRMDVAGMRLVGWAGLCLGSRWGGEVVEYALVGL